MALPTEQASREIIVGRSRRVNLVRLARAQRLLLRLVLAMLALYFGFMFLPRLIPYRNVMSIVFPAMLVLFLIVGVLIIVQTVRLAIASGRSPIAAAIAGVFMLVPLVGLLLVASANGRATRLLREHGAKVGFLGVTAGEMLKLTNGYCHGCGYPLEGLAGTVCPECGAALPQR